MSLRYPITDVVEFCGRTMRQLGPGQPVLLPYKEVSVGESDTVFDLAVTSYGNSYGYWSLMDLNSGWIDPFGGHGIVIRVPI